MFFLKNERIFPQNYGESDEYGGFT